MSWQAVKTVLHKSTQSGTTKLVLVCIAEHYNEETKTAWPGIDTLAKYCNVSRQSIFNSIDKLKAAGELEVDYKKGVNGVNVYRLPILKDSEPSSQLDSQASFTVKPALLNSQASFTETVKPALPEPYRTINNHNKKSAPVEPAEPTPPPTPKPNNKKPDTIPAFQVYVEVTGAYSLTKKQRALIGDAVGSDPAALARWGDVVKEWVLLRGYNPRNIGGMLEWFRDGKPKPTNKGAKQNGKQYVTSDGKTAEQLAYERDFLAQIGIS